MCSAPSAPAPTPPTAPVEAPLAMALPDNEKSLGLAALRIGGQSLTSAQAAATKAKVADQSVISPLSLSKPAKASSPLSLFGASPTVFSNNDIGGP